MIELSPETALNKARIEKRIKLGATLLLALVLSPVVYLIIKGIVGIAAALGLVALIAWAVPLIADKFSTWKLKIQKHEAATNPIETLQKEYIKNCEGRDMFREHLETLIAKKKKYEDDLSQMKRDFPEEADKMEEEHSQLVQLVEFQQQKYDELCDYIERFSKEIKKFEARWSLRQTANDIHNAVGMATDDAISQIKKETAIEAVQLGMNKVFAEMEMSLRDGKRAAAKNAPQLADKQPVLTIFPPENTPQPVRRKLQ